MNALGWILIAPIIALLLVDPIGSIPALIFIVGWIAAWLWLINRVIGKKD